MTDDPWRKPDPPGSVPPPPAPYPAYPGPAPYAPQNPYQAPYGPPPYQQYNPYNQYVPYDPNNPYQAPLPQRGGFGKLLWILCTAGILLLGGCGVGIYFFAHSLTKNADEANAFLRNMRDRQFSAAYQHLCPSVRATLTESDFSTSATAVADEGHGLASFDLIASLTSTGNGVTRRTASGTVTLANGAIQQITIFLGKTSGHLCVLSGFESLY